MIELYEAAFSGINVAYTVLLILVLLYWCIVMLGIVDLNLFDVDLDVGGGAGTDFDVGGVDVHADVDASIDVDGAAESVGGFSWLAYFNMGEVPIMIYATIVVLVMWIVSVQTNHWLDSVQVPWIQSHRGWVAAGLALPNFVFGMHVAKFLMLPVKRLKREHTIVTTHDGKLCLVRSLEVNNKYGQVEIPTDESPLLLNARTEGDEELHKGDAASIVRHVATDHENYYIVTKHTKPSV